MVIKKTVFYLFLISGLFGAFQAQAMEAGLPRARSNSAPPEPGSGIVLVGFDGSQAGQLCRTRSHSDSQVPVTLLVLFGGLTNSTSDSCVGWDVGSESGKGPTQDDPEPAVSPVWSQQASLRGVSPASLGRRAGRAVAKRLRGLIPVPQDKKSDGDNSGLLVRAGRSQSDPTPFAPIAELKKQRDECQGVLDNLKKKFAAAEEEVGKIFQAELDGVEGSKEKRIDAISKRYQLQQEVAEGEGRIASISNAIFLLGMARFN